MELLDIKIFCDLIELKSYTEAAKSNFLTQSAVSQRINRLNQYYGNKIFLDKKRLILSWHGKYLYEKFKDILKIYSSTEEIIERKDAKDIVSIGFSNNAKVRYFSKDLVEIIFSKNILPEIYFGPSQSIYEKVLFGTLDYGVVGGIPQKSNNLVFNKLYSEKIVLVTSLKNTSKNIQLEEMPIILDHRDSGLYMFLKNELAVQGKDIEQLKIIGYVGTSDEKLLVLPNNTCYCFLPESYVKKRPNLKIIPLDPELRRSFYEIYLKKRMNKIAFLSDLLRNIIDSKSD
jgi:DNA-binding transcriptional LysR family regulator